MIQKKQVRKHYWAFAGIALCLGLTVLWYAFRSSGPVSAARSESFEKVLKSEVYHSVNEELGTYLEDGKADSAADWAAQVVQAVLDKYGLTVDDKLTDPIKATLTEAFQNLIESGFAETNGMGSCSELAKAYVTNAIAVSVFAVVPDLADTAVQTETKEGPETEEIAQINEVLEQFRVQYQEIIEKAQATYDTSQVYAHELEEKTGALAADIEALQTLINLVQSTTVTTEEWEAQTAARLNSIALLTERLDDMAAELEETKAVTGEEISALRASLTLISEESGVFRDTVTAYMAANDVRLLELQEDFGLELLSVNDTLNGRMESYYQALLSMFNGQGEQITALQEKDAALTDQVTALAARLDSSHSDLQLVILGLSTRMEQYMSQTNTEIAGIKARLTDLEGRFISSTQTVTELLGGLATRTAALDTAGLRSKIEDNTALLEQKLSKLAALLAGLQGTLGDTAEEGQVSEQIMQVLLQLEDVRASVVDYGITLSARLDALDTSILTAQTSLADMNEETQALFLNAATGLVGIQNAENVYFSSLQTQVAELTNAVQNVTVEANRVAGTLYTDASVASGSAILTEQLQNQREDLENKLAVQRQELEQAMAVQRQEIDAEISGLEQTMTGLIQDLTEATEEKDTNLNDRLEDLEDRLVITRLDGFVIAADDWIPDSATGRLYYEIRSDAFTDSSHVDIQYGGEPGIEPFYTGTTGLMRISVRYPAEVVVSNIFIYNHAAALSQTDSGETDIEEIAQ